MLSKIFAISKKEIWQIMRDKRSLLIIFVLPVFLLILFGYAITLDVHDIQLAVYDMDKSETSRDFISTFSGSQYFEIVSYIDRDNSINELLDRGIAQCIMVIPQNFSKDIISKKMFRCSF